MTGTSWRCSICGRTYIARTVQYSVIHDGKTYCMRCHHDWERTQERIKADNIRRQEMERKKQRIAAFETARIQNGEYQPERGGKNAVVAAGLLTLDHTSGPDINDTLWAEVYGNKITCHRTRYTGSEFSGYHDEDDDYYATDAVQTPPFLEDANWFESEIWLQKTRVPYAANAFPALDSLYYEGHGKATTTRWKTRWYDSDTTNGSLIIWLRRCTEGWRLLRISLGGTVVPFDFDFREDTIPMLYNQYAAKCNIFQDFQLTDEERAYIADGLNMKHDNYRTSYEPCGNSISFILEAEHHLAEESDIPQKLLGDLLGIRCLNVEDYWERIVNPNV